MAMILDTVLSAQMKQLAQLNEDQEFLSGQADTIMAEIKETLLWKQHESAKAEAKEVADRIRELRKEIEKNALERYRAAQDKSIVAGLGIRCYTKLKYDQQEAIDWVIEQRATQMLKLDTRKFNKFAKAAADAMPLEFVEIYEDPVVTISSDLSEWLMYEKKA